MCCACFWIYIQYEFIKQSCSSLADKSDRPTVACKTSFVTHSLKLCHAELRLYLNGWPPRQNLITRKLLKAVKFHSKLLRFTGWPYQWRRDYPCVVLVSEYISHRKFMNHIVFLLLVNSLGQQWGARLALSYVHRSCVMPNSVCTWTGDHQDMSNNSYILECGAISQQKNPFYG